MTGLYRIVGQKEEGLFEVRLNPDHPVFRGHFPGRPILPGVCSLMLVRACAERMTGAPLRYSTVRESKFLAAITPEARLAVELKLAGEHRVDATIRSGETVMLKLKAELE